MIPKISHLEYFPKDFYEIWLEFGVVAQLPTDLRI